MFWLRNKKNNFSLRTLIWGPVLARLCRRAGWIEPYMIINIENSEYDQEIPQSQTADNLWHLEEEPHNNHETPGRQSKATSSLYPIKMIAKPVLKTGFVHSKAHILHT